MPSISSIKRHAYDLLNYLWIAIIGTAVNIGSRIIYSEKFGVEFGTSVVIAYATGMVVGFALSKLFAFKSRTSDNTYSEAAKFVMVSGAALTVTWFVSVVIKHEADVILSNNPRIYSTAINIAAATGEKFVNRELASHVIGIGIGFFVNYFGHKFFTFRKTGVWDKVQSSRNERV